MTQPAVFDSMKGQCVSAHRLLCWTVIQLSAECFQMSASQLWWGWGSWEATVAASSTSWHHHKCCWTVWWADGEKAVGKETEDISEAAADFFDSGPFSALLDRAVKISDSKAERKGAWPGSKPGQLLSTSWSPAHPSELHQQPFHTLYTVKHCVWTSANNRLHLSLDYMLLYCFYSISSSTSWAALT